VTKKRRDDQKEKKEDKGEKKRERWKREVLDYFLSGAKKNIFLVKNLS